MQTPTQTKVELIEDALLESVSGGTVEIDLCSINLCSINLCDLCFFA